MVGRQENIESVWTRLQKISILSHAFHDFLKRSNNEGDFPLFFSKEKN